MCNAQGNLVSQRKGWGRSQTTVPKISRHQKEIAIQRGDLQRLKKAFRKATEVEKPALTEIRDNLRERIKFLRRAECHRRDRKRQTKERVDFTKNPFEYLSKLLGDKRSEELKATKEQVEEHQVHSDPRREDSLEEMEELIKPAEPTIPFGAEEPSWQEVKHVLKKARGKSAPGPNGIPYSVQVLRKAQTTTLEATEGSMEEELPR
ncbi:hypothetical protein N1851_024123 [Merluccius polli]|uniref:Uncharacterized protein n=1 Tax=Merluccius polli TaxID=89951 RepID=A0AA47MFJ2_MERPO|nr:hypothetical protein N1851_024123 [Merluccius polli]